MQVDGRPVQPKKEMLVGNAIFNYVTSDRLHQFYLTNTKNFTNAFMRKIQN